MVVLGKSSPIWQRLLWKWTHTHSWHPSIKQNTKNYLCPFNPSEKWQERERAKLRNMLVIEAHWWKLWNTHLFSHRNTENWLDSLTQDTRQCSKFMNSKWHYKFAKHNTTPQYVYQSIFKIFAKFFLLFPHSQLLTTQVFLFLFPVVWPGLYWFPGSLALWTTCSVPVPAVCLQIHVLPSGLSAWSWFP